MSQVSEKLRRLFISTSVAIPLLVLIGCGEDGGGGSANRSLSNSINDVALVVVNNTGSVTGEGSTDRILAGELTYHDSTQPPSEVRFTVTSSPRSGQLELISAPGNSINQFTQADIDAGRVVYKHERGNAATDGFEFDVDDGLGNILRGQKFVINVIANVSSLNLTFDTGVVHLSWKNPVNNGFIGVEIRRRDDGSYPATSADGVPIYKTQLGDSQTTDVVSSDTSDVPIFHYYTVFSFGSDGTYSEGMNVGLYCNSGKCMTVPDLRGLNNIHSSQDAGNLRKKLINEVWGIDRLPDWMPTSVFDTLDTRFSYAASIKMIVLQMDSGLVSRMKLYSPFAANGKLVIYHEGHTGNTDRGIEIMQRFLQEGFHVLQVSMLLTGNNWFPDSPFASHDDFAGLERPMRFFLEPVTVALNYLTSLQNFDGIYMVGISGGGWTTVVYSALDTRITASYPVAGSYPFYLRDQLGGPSFGDFEQINPEFYQYVSYIELYLLGAEGRRQLQIYNKYDTCCFGGTYSDTFKDYLMDSVNEIGGSIDIIVDDTFIGHDISDFALQKILDDIDLN